MERGRSRAFRTTPWAEGALWLLIFFAPLALGSAPRWTLWPLWGLSFMAAGLVLWGAARRNERLSLPVLATVPALGAALCVLQLVPLPPWLLAVASPQAEQLRQHTLLPLGLGSWRPVSLEPAATYYELAKHLCYLAVVLAAAQVARHRHARRRLFGAVALSGALVALIGFGHRLLGVSLLFGVHKYQGNVPFVSTFGNPNHLAAMLSLSATAAMGLALSGRERQRRFLWGLCYLLSGAGVLLSLSRGGVVFFFVSQLLLSGFFLVFRRREGQASAPVGRAAFVAAAALCVLATGAYLAYERLQGELSTADSVEKLRGTKVKLWPMFAEGARAYWPAGMGRGAFEVAFTAHQTQRPFEQYTHPENFILQLGSEFGFVFGAGLVLLALWAFWRVAGGSGGSPLGLAALCAALGIGLHNLFDFNLELAACAVAVLVLLAAAARGGADLKTSLSARHALAALCGLAVVGGASAFAGRNTYRAAGEELAALTGSGASAQQLQDAALKRIDQHPADYFLYAQVAAALASTQPAQALAYANRALALRPIDAATHRVAARSLLRLGRKSQALLEYRLGAQAGDGGALKEGLSHARGADELVRLVADEPGALAQLTERLRSAGRKEEASAVLAHALQAHGEQPLAQRLWLLRARELLAGNDAQGALEAVEAAAKVGGGAVSVELTRASVLSQLGRLEEAVAVLTPLLPENADNLELALALSGHQSAAGHLREALETLQRAAPFISEPGPRVRLALAEGALHQKAGRSRKALEAYELAARLQPQSIAAQQKLAALYESSGRYEEAARALRAAVAAAAGRASPQQEAWLDRLEQKLLDRAQRIAE